MVAVLFRHSDGCEDHGNPDRYGPSGTAIVFFESRKTVEVRPLSAVNPEFAT